MRANPMLRALDHKIAALIARRMELDGQIDVLKAIRVELGSLVRKRGKPPRPAPSPNTEATTTTA